VKAKLVLPLGSVILLSLATFARGQGSSAGSDPAAGLRRGPATVAPHWSKYKYPETIPEGAAYHIVERGDTLWDLSKRYLNNPFLWPQIWDKNRYITDAHWIYPGDPIILPDISLVSDGAGAGGPGTGAEGMGAEGLGPEGAGEGDAASRLYQISEEETIRCASFISDGEDDSLKILGHEMGSERMSFAARDILYLNKGSNAGVRVGDVYTAHHKTYKVKHPKSTRHIGQKIETTGWLRVLLVSENTATAIVETACLDMHPDDYLKPFERVNVPLVRRVAPPNRLTPPTGKTGGYIIDHELDKGATGQGDLLSIDLGSNDGIAPGNRMTVFRVTYPTVPTARNVVGELAVLTVRDRTALAKVVYSNDGILIGDQVELR
jgi:hypothetical protein